MHNITHEKYQLQLNIKKPLAPVKELIQPLDNSTKEVTPQRGLV